MHQVLVIVQAVLAGLLCLCILVQHRMSGLTSTFGGSGAIAVQRRGAEKVIYKLTIWMSVAFFVLTIVEWYV